MSKSINTPKKFRHSKIPEFLSSVEFIFKIQGKQIENFTFNVKKTEDISLLGILLTYKFIEYTVNKKCFYKPQFKDTTDHRYKGFLNEWGFSDLIKKYLNQKENSTLKNRLRVIESDNFFIAPQALLRNDSSYTRDSLSKKYFPVFKKYYNNDKVVRMIFSVFSEILLNFWRHATEDDESIIMAKGNNSRIEIACADNGNGIISNLKNILKPKGLNSEEILSEAVKKNVTSKPNTNHMGYGLFMFDQIALKSNSTLEIYSEGVFYQRRGIKKSCQKCGYWKGTIVYLSLNLHRPITIEDIESKDLKKAHLINWT